MSPIRDAAAPSQKTGSAPSETTAICANASDKRRRPDHPERRQQHEETDRRVLRGARSARPSIRASPRADAPAQCSRRPAPCSRGRSGPRGTRHSRRARSQRGGPSTPPSPPRWSTATHARGRSPRHETQGPHAGAPNCSIEPLVASSRGLRSSRPPVVRASPTARRDAIVIAADRERPGRLERGRMSAPRRKHHRERDEPEDAEPRLRKSDDDRPEVRNSGATRSA